MHTYAVSPGFVATGLFKNTMLNFSFINWLMDIGQGYYVRGPKLGAATSICCAVDEDIGKQTGLYYQ